MKKFLITAALPYINNIPHLGNLVQVLSADAFSRYCQAIGRETLYICGTDEYGTATETKALEEGVTPKEICDRFHAIHKDIYQWFNISFSHFGRTSDPIHSEVTKQIFLDLDKNGYVIEKNTTQLYLASKDLFLADRYIKGQCPFCGFLQARGDQCESCGKLLDPIDLIDPWTALAPGEKLEIRSTNHLYLDLVALKKQLEDWLLTLKIEERWAHNAVKMTKAWLRDGLKPRAITRDLKWGIPVPKEQFHSKVFYVWFDAPIGYISMTAKHLPQNWKSWWQNPDEVNLVQFVGKDNIPFHTVVFPCSLLGSGQRWTMLHTISSSEYLNYEGGKFSKSQGIGVFGNDAQESGIAVDIWRFYLFFNRPERNDTLFAWSDFQEHVNSDLIGNFSNLVHRTLTFSRKNFGAQAPEGSPDKELWIKIKQKEQIILDCLERIELREALKHILELSDLGNKTFQDAEPWKLLKTSPQKAACLLYNLLYLVRDLSLLIWPYLPQTSSKILGFLGTSFTSWDDLANLTGINLVNEPQILFKKLEDDQIANLKARFSGRQDSSQNQVSAPNPSPEDFFRSSIDLRVAKIACVKAHPKADRLYVLCLETGSGQTQIVSGLVQHYTASQLLHHHIIWVSNLKPAKLRGEVSNGMLLAASAQTNTGEVVEVLFADQVSLGTQVVLQDQPCSNEQKKVISIDEFSQVPLKVIDGRVKLGTFLLTAQGQPLTTLIVKNGSID